MRPFKRTDIKSDYYYIHVRGKRVCTFLTDYRAASLWVKQQERKAADPALAAAERATVGQALELRMAKARRDGRTPATLRFLECKIRSLALHLGSERALSRINAFAIDAFIDARGAQGVSRHTIAKELTVLRTSLQLAKRGGLFAVDLDAVFTSYDAAYKPRERALTEKEAQMILAPTGGRWAASSSAIAFILGTGARLGEAARARPGDIDWNRGSVLVRGTKSLRHGEGDRYVPITKINEPYLRRAEAEGIRTTWAEDAIRIALVRRCERMKIEHASPNDLRRTFATWHREAGVALEHLAPMMGHTTTRMLELVYAKLKPDALVEILGRYEAVAYVKREQKGEEREPCETQKPARKTRIRTLPVSP